MAKTFLSPKERRGLLFLSLIIVVTISAGIIRSCMPRQNYMTEKVISKQDKVVLTTDTLANKQQKDAKTKRKGNRKKSRKKSSYKERKPLEDIIPSK